MAAVTQVIQEMLCCSRCDVLMSSPVTLNCYHSFCQSCMNSLEENKQQHMSGNLGVSCPLCKVFTKNEECLSKFVLNKCVEVLSYQARLDRGAISCMECDSTEIDSKCFSCNKELCVGCVKTHHTIPQFKDHRLVKISDAPLESIENMHVFCSKHTNHELLFNCIQCQTAICQQCKIQYHNTHQSESVAVAAEKILPEVHQKIKNYLRRIKEFNNSLSFFDLEAKKLELNVNSMKKQLQEQKLQTMAKIEADYHSLCDRVDKEANTLAANIQSKKQWVKFELAHQKSIVNWANNILGLINGACLLMELRTSIVPAVTAHDKKVPSDKLNLDPSLLSFVPTARFSGNENTLGDITVSNMPQPPLSKAEVDLFSPLPLVRDIPNHTQGTKRSFPVPDDTREIVSQPPRLEVIQDEDLLKNKETGLNNNIGQVTERNRDDSPTSVASIPTGQDRIRNNKSGMKQVSFVRSVITPLHEDDETLADGRVSRASDRLSRASVNLPLVPSQSSKTKAPYGRYSVNSMAPQELGWTKRKRSQERSPARSLTEDAKGPDLTPVQNERSFRCIIRSKYSDLTSVICKPTGEFRIKNFHNRMCIIEDEIWMPLTEENSVAIYSTAGSLLKEKLPFENVERPHAFHALNEDHILIAAENGLYILFSANMSTSLILRGNFSDVCVDKTIAVALECKQGKVYVLNFQKKPVQKSSFRINFKLVNMYKNESKLVLSDQNIFISVYNDEPLLKYDLSGKLLGEFGQWGKGVAGNMGSPKVCAADNKGNVLVSDSANNRLQVMNPNSKWSVLLSHVNHPKDAVVLEGGLLYILTDDHKILMFRAEKV